MADTRASGSHDEAASAPSEVDAVAESPRGKVAVSEALVSAAIELFGARTPDKVSVREIASRARVNQGLVHQYFGS